MSPESGEKSPTTIASYGLAIKNAMAANGYDVQGLFSTAGIDKAPSNDPLDRLTTAQVAALFDECVKLTGNPAIGLTVARFMHPSSIHALGYSLLASSSLRDCCLRMVNYFRLVSEQAELATIEEEYRFYLRTRIISDALALESQDAWHAFVVRLFRLIYKPDFEPVSVSLARPCPPGYEAQYKKSFGESLTFDTPYWEICIATTDLDVPLSGGNREIALQNDQIIENYLTAMNKADIVSRVKQVIVQSLPSGQCSKKQVADEMAMSTSNLQLKLAERGYSFQDLLGQVRATLAKAYMEQGLVSLTEMSFLLGFSDSSSFTRAFRRWTGKSPRQYRSELQAGRQH